ncbi:uroporphyrinogen-III C-methyltransferase [Macrococcus brunensis]|uniref:uroporphyrinogen-III C-methyltransferase n=1 Tax=Macrococcus brunensis TaxID=198483 RepID=A0A4V3BDT7_9STAP|nr:uroporphyrinogen-III C-methyltransferase [Macrococcus brunensis]TDL98546.1 uroporphyrinogen-III C-methyltransferase [Macrococcus brunensis]
MGVGKVYFVGAGPGDPGLLTLKARRAIEKADVIIYDRLVNPILLQLSKPECKLIYVGKNPDVKYMKQDMINEVINHEAAKGLQIVRLKGGDPAIFGRLTEEVESLVHTDYEVIPGITSATAAAVYSGFPLTDREYSPHVTFATGHLQKDSVKEIDFQALAKGGTLALYMGMKELPNIVKVLIDQNGETLPIAVIGQASYGYQKTVISNLCHIERAVGEAKVSHPAMIIVGDVVRCRKTESWFEKKTNFGRKILIVSESKIEIDDVLERFDDGGYYYLIDQLTDTTHSEKYADVHRDVLKAVAFDEISGTDAAKALFKQQFAID